MKLLYIAGPFTAPTPWEIEQNIRNAEEAEETVIELGGDRFACIVPHSLGRHFVGRAGTPAYWYAATMRMMEACDCVLFIGDWWSSKGCRAEFRRAVELGLAIYGDILSLIDSEAMTQEAIARVLEGLPA